MLFHETTVCIDEVLRDKLNLVLEVYMCIYKCCTFMLHPFLMTEKPTDAQNVTVNAERDTGEQSVTIRVTWMQPPNFDQFDIDRYDITVTSTSGVQNMTMACGQCTNTTVTMSENSNTLISTTFNVTITAVSLCGETGPTATALETLSKFHHI